MMSPLEQGKLVMYRVALGPMSTDMALAHAIDAEQTAKACGPYDPAFVRFKDDQRSFETYAELLEKDSLNPSL